MNARVLIVDESHAAKALALVCAVALGGEVAEEPEGPSDHDLGFMEFSDWLATTGDVELLSLAKEFNVEHAPLAERPLAAIERETIGKAVWACL